MDQENNPDIPTAPSTANSSKLYIIKPIAGKGQGFIASTKIAKGTRILAEAATFKVPRFATNASLIENFIAQGLRRLSKDEQRAFFSLHNAYKSAHKPIVGIMKTNALPLGSSAMQSGLFLDASRINHACAPNAQNTWNATLDKLTVHAVKDVAEGEEITISYLDGTGTHAARQRKLSDAFGFACTCGTCSLPALARQSSDAAQSEIARLDARVADGVQIVATPLACLHDARAVLRLLREEGITDARLPRAYYDAFQIAIANGDLARARVFAQRACVGRVLCEGEDSPEVGRLRALVERPAEHPSYGTTMRWRQAVKKVPLGLGEDEFEKWLWRVAK